MPANIPAIAPSLLMFLEKIPIINTGKIDEAAKPKAKATVPAAKSGGLKPKYPATAIEAAIETRLALSSSFSDFFGLKTPFNKS